MAKYIITEQPIDVYTCVNDPTRTCTAVIRGWPMMFQGATPMRARKVADDWRRNAVLDDKLLTTAQKAAMLGEVTA